ncbi:AAA family ATPase [Mesoaciditoga sp.]
MIEDQAVALRNSVDTAKFVVFASGKGGVGKSLVTLNTAVSLAKRGKKVLVIDMDVGFANLDVLGGINVKHTLKDFFNEGLSVKDILEETAYGFSLLSSGNDVEDIYAFEMGEMERFFSEFQMLGNEMDYVLIDMGAGYSEKMDSAYMASDDFVLVLTPEPTAIMDAYTFLKILSLKGLKSKLYLMVNMANSLNEGRMLGKRFQEITSKFTTLKFEKSYSMLNDIRVKKSVREQKPFVLSYKHIQPTFGVMGLVSAIMENQHEMVNRKGSFVEKIKKFFRWGR